MRFADITGQEDLKRHLVQSVDAGRISHAQLFTGQAGAGALALAVAYVQYLCCRHRRGGDSCGECPDCKQIAALAHPDLHLVFPVNKQGKKSGEVMRSDEFLPLFRGLFAERGGYFSAQDWYDRLDLGKTLKGMIAAREADDIIRKLSFKSFEADYKTMLIWLPEAMNGCCRPSFPARRRSPYRVSRPMCWNARRRSGALRTRSRPGTSPVWPAAIWWSCSTSWPVKATPCAKRTSNSSAG